jgi:hypothetical protein
LKLDIYGIRPKICLLTQGGAIVIARKISLIVGLVVIGLALNKAASAQSEQATGVSPPGRLEAIRSITVITVHGKIAEVDKTKSRLYLKDPKGGRSP